MTDSEYAQLKIGERVLVHEHLDPANPLYEGIVSKREELPGGGVVIRVLIARGPETTWESSVMAPAARSMHRVPFDGSQPCPLCSWKKIEYLAGDKEHPFTG